MRQVKKSLYELYPRVTDFMVNQLKKLMPKSETRRTDADVVREVIRQIPMMMNSLDFLIMTEELYWIKNGGEVIFPESDVVLNNCFKSKFSISTSHGFELPFDSFMLAMPNGYTFMGTKLPALFVNFYDYHNSIDDIIYPFCDWAKIRRPDNVAKEDVPIGSRAISISYRDPETNMGYVRLLVGEEKIPDLLGAENIETFSKIMGRFNNIIGVIEPSTDDLEIQFKAIKLVAALGVYNLATHGDRLKKGFPGQSMPRMNFKNPDLRMSLNTLSSKLPSQLEKSSPDAHYRTWHIRQLRDERFYKGDHEKEIPGSRFVFVSDAVIGTKVSPSTQT
jgi:hypothetical protein